MYLLDTDVLIWILRGRNDIVEYISSLKENHPMAISVISIAEVYMNIFPSELVDTEEHLEQYVTFEVDQKVAKLAGLYWQQYSKNLKKLSLVDCLIAATVNVNGATLISLNLKHFPMKDIKTLDPSLMN